MSGARPLLLNGGEMRVHRALREALDSHSLHLDAKVRAASILPIDGSGISDDDFSYALRSEFDFGVSKGPNRTPEFVVEFDGARHLCDPETLVRDRRKERLCSHFDLPLLRIGIEALDRPRKETILAWLINVYYLAEEFDRLQARGVIAPDEPFMYFSIFDATPDGRLGPSMALDEQARLLMFEAARDGLARTHVPEEVTLDAYAPGERPELIESYALFELDENRFVIGHASLRNFDHFGGVTASELASDLAGADAGKHLELFRRGRYRPANRSTLAKIRASTKGWLRTVPSVATFRSPRASRPAPRSEAASERACCSQSPLPSATSYV
jgi:hypothetical protein